ncbi:MAG: UDP-N-acetylmuramoyl-tripeptide--D-alanyl-D-alanine ligase [Gallionellales bacterium 35-53-114]|nr:MAG: UDP-N-acetylmuramoyl-tripeptide--D-alanyl-D-alanine ligase [Gallionellales bacterium 35-53-114]OYZ64043.1 MAG: UDP-N-acetylmuramoyl-tripeptide--D-alanyl-D-alanine ligase [Gallionellales bacterium 24-53-125]OZB09569.1 MAG: UDP-N-acetylmuramoyl-tripeptide--D-alanyl-D-alanine ligase [Gallionellales bacterium 39-52-133]
MMPLSKVAQVLGGELVGQDVEFDAVSTDSRSINKGDLFVALHGDKFDGSQYVSLAAEKGAVAALVNAESYHGETMPCPLVLVKDTRLALGKLAGYWRDQFAIPLVAITGSNGKTTVKEMLTAILREAAGSEEAVLATQGNFNNDIGMPLTLLRLRKQHKYAVIEMGMNHTGEIDYLTRLASPDVAIINNAGSAHIANLGSLEAIAQAKGEIFAGLAKQGTAVISADEKFAPMWRVLAGSHPLVEFALDAPASVSAKAQVLDFIQLIEVATPLGKFAAKLQVPGLHNVRNALAATAAAVALKISPTVIAAGLEKFSGVAGRLQRRPALHGAVVIDDSYNANPMSLLAAIEVLTQARGKKMLVLGDMGELGIEASKMHAEMGAAARKLGVNQLYALGELSSYAVKEFGAGARHFLSAEELLEALKKELAADCTVLVKGSRFMKMERVVKELVSGEPEAAGAVLAQH